jgi:hypothetical protein
MKLKFDDKGNVVVIEDKPVFIMDDGSEVPFDVPSAMSKIGELNNEAKTHRLAAKDAKEKLVKFDGIDDPEAAKKALQFARSMDGKKAMDDESIKALIENSVKPFKDEVASKDKMIKEKDDHIYRLEVSNRFASSSYLKEKTIFGETPEVAEAYFGKHFKIEGGKVVAYDAAGNQMYSRSKPGELANFDEAVSILVDSHPKKNHILKASSASGSGAQGGGGAHRPGTKTMSRAEFDGLSPKDQMQFSKDGGKLTD